MNTTDKKLGILVLNGEKGRLFTYENQKLRELDDFVSVSEDYTDNRDSFQKTQIGDARFAYGSKREKSRISEHNRHLFFKQIENRLRSHYLNKKFDQLLIIAPKTIKNTFENALHIDLQNQIFASLDANLVGLSWQDIQKRLASQFSAFDTARI